MDRPCPTCGDPAVSDRSNPWRPFCSERCKLVDLSRWLDGAYAIPGPPADLEGQPSTRPGGGGAILDFEDA